MRGLCNVGVMARASATATALSTTPPRAPSLRPPRLASNAPERSEPTARALTARAYPMRRARGAPPRVGTVGAMVGGRWPCRRPDFGGTPRRDGGGGAFTVPIPAMGLAHVARRNAPMARVALRKWRCKGARTPW